MTNYAKSTSCSTYLALGPQPRFLELGSEFNISRKDYGVATTDKVMEALGLLRNFQRARKEEDSERERQTLAGRRKTRS